METEYGAEDKKLREYESNNTMLEFNLTTGGIIRGKIKWVDKHCIGLELGENQSIILYKHAIAFIQEKAT